MVANGPWYFRAMLGVFGILFHDLVGKIGIGGAASSSAP
jgi:hypothetical protein